MNTRWLAGLVAVAGLLVAFVSPVSPVSAPGRTRPHILWISCEDMSPRLSCYGDSTGGPGKPLTPNIDRLAREGVRYTNAFCTAGVCAPSRNAIITGMYQTSTGGHNMRTLNNTYPEKTGLPKEYAVVMPPSVKAFPEYLRAQGYYTTNNAKTDYQFEAPPTVWDEVGNSAHWRKRPTDRPFFAVFNSVVTHESQVWYGATGRRKDLPLRVDPARIQVPPYYPDTKTVRQDMARFYSNIREMDDWVGEILQQLEADGLLDKTLIFFWSDHGDGLPFVKREVYDRGIRVPLIVRFPDGRFAGTTRSELISMIDLAPTVLNLAGVRPPAYMQGQAFLDLETGQRPRRTPARPYVFAARDRLDSEYDRVRTVHDGRFQYVRNFFPEKPLYMDLEYRKQQPMMAELLRMRDAGQLNPTQMHWFQPTKPAEELYDIQKDPYELNNLARQSAYAPQLKRLRAALDQWLAQSTDLGAIPEKDLVRTWWNGQNNPPATEAPNIQVTGNQLTISCTTEGASIGYQWAGDDTGWQVYTGPVPVRKGARLRATAMRIGYTQSPVVSQEL
ncbi:sulfatase-like hydrolase/transferase [Rudanella paleaurantiibacter]|uniref:Sulfatase-like hydrolase/transferase n=1 Tax=Rudanella paleaurantiibacter TaxID=2614655 RepID=A0A7J5U0H5_9BACT|nr:sulfatase [Rudanella paleaurantiibacter]KAB7731179.1 sulfatase-like hydrolase/transferase [Rudanella paleaurantiibacter]